MKRRYLYSIYAILCVVVTLSFGALALRASEWHRQYLIQTVGQSVVMLVRPDGMAGGTGFVVRAPSGRLVIVTNHHICGLAYDGTLKSISFGKSPQTVKIIKASDDYDLCVLTAPSNLKPLRLAAELRVNQEIASIGHPYLQYKVLQRGYLVNFISSAGEESARAYIRALGTSDQLGSITYAGRTTILTYPGNSGSPAVNFYGEVVGVMFATDIRDMQGILVPLKPLTKFLSRF